MDRFNWMGLWWVIDPKGGLDIRSVEVARAGVDQAIIANGLAAGERVCTSNLQYVTHGMPVRVAGDPAPADDKPAETAAKDGDR